MYRVNNRHGAKLTVSLLLLLLFPTFACANVNKLPVDEFTSKYDSNFRKASKQYFGVGFDWR